MSDGVKREIAKVKLNEGALDDEPEKVWVRLSDGRLADDLIEPRPLRVFQGAFERRNIYRRL